MCYTQKKKYMNKRMCFYEFSKGQTRKIFNPAILRAFNSENYSLVYVGSFMQAIIHARVWYLAGNLYYQKGEFMYLPKIYESFSDEFPEVFKEYNQLGKTCRDAGPLEQKVQDLIKLGIAVGANSKGAVMSHTRKALASGAAPDEITHAVLLSLTTTGFPNMMAAMGWVKEVLKEYQTE